MTTVEGLEDGEREGDGGIELAGRGGHCGESRTGEQGEGEGERE